LHEAIEHGIIQLVRRSDFLHDHSALRITFFPNFSGRLCQCAGAASESPKSNCTLQEASSR
jgi:hypothetical protein